MTDEFPSNSNRKKDNISEPKKEVEEAKSEKDVKRIVQSEVIKRKKPLHRRFTETFIGGDSRGVWDYVVFDVLVPAAKDMLADAVSQGTERMIFGEPRSRSRRGGRNPSKGRGSFTSYNHMSKARRPDPRDRRPRMSSRARASHDFGEIVLEFRNEAEEVIDRLYDLAEKYEVATVADLYSMVGIDVEYTDDQWGWSNLEGSGVSRIRQGYLLDLPQPEPID